MWPTTRRSIGAIAAFLLLFAAAASVRCGGDARPAAVPRADGATLNLDALPFKELTLPDASRDAPPPEWLPLSGPFQYVGTTRKGMHRWQTDLPVRPRGLFFHKAQPGMALRSAGEGHTLRYDRFGESEMPTWAHDRTTLTVFLKDKGTGPPAGGLEFAWPLAGERERRLNRAMSGLSDEEFVRATVADGWDNRRGLLLPAPAVVAWEIAVPKAAEFRFAAGLVAPEVREGAPSDGSRLVAEVVDGADTTPIFEHALAAVGFADHTVDLTRWAGRKVVLRVRTEPGETSRFDYAFLAEPVVASRASNPSRVLLVFIDTLRPDHLSYNGYDRPTSPRLDALVERAVSFDNTRSVAPWTLPSARSVLTGRQPEWYGTERGRTLQAMLRDHGYASAMFSGNVYLSANFDMERDWDFHRVGLWPLAEDVTDEALAWMAAHEGRDWLLQVHYMGCHLPYIEPMPYRTMFAGSPVGGLRDEFHLSDVKQAHIDDDAAAQEWVRGRYDNAIRYVTDQVGRLIDAMGPDDIIVVYSDHGEEFWEHRGFEHGHTLFDELLRVPLVIAAPGLAPRRVTEPTSLLDVTPTVLDLLGLPASDFDGTSLRGLGAGDADAAVAFAARDQAFGRPLYGTERWGVLHGAEKWSINEGREALYDLADDPQERKNLVKADPADSAAPFRDRLAEVLGRDVDLGWRLVPTPPRGGAPQDAVVTLTVPGGWKAAWVGADSLELSSAEVRIDGDDAIATWRAGYGGSVEVFFVPKIPLAEATPQLQGVAVQGDQTFELRPDPKFGATPGAVRIPLARAQFRNRTIALTWGVAPAPDASAGVIKARDPEMNATLAALGYAEPDEEATASHDDDEKGKAKSKAKAKAP
jgi:arylsulfatase A-like enzyme